MVHHIHVKVKMGYPLVKELVQERAQASELLKCSLERLA